MEAQHAPPVTGAPHRNLALSPTKDHKTRGGSRDGQTWAQGDNELPAGRAAREAAMGQEHSWGSSEEQ